MLVKLIQKWSLTSFLKITKTAHPEGWWNRFFIFVKASKQLIFFKTTRICLPPIFFIPFHKFFHILCKWFLDFESFFLLELIEGRRFKYYALIFVGYCIRWSDNFELKSIILGFTVVHEENNYAKGKEGNLKTRKIIRSKNLLSYCCQLIDTQWIKFVLYQNHSIFSHYSPFIFSSSHTFLLF